MRLRCFYENFNKFHIFKEFKCVKSIFFGFLGSVYLQATMRSTNMDIPYNLHRSNQTSSNLLWIFSQWNVLFGVLLFRKTKYSYNCSLDAKISKQCWCCVRSHSAYIWHSFTQCVLLQRSTLITFECEKNLPSVRLMSTISCSLKSNEKLQPKKQKNTTTG